MFFLKQSTAVTLRIGPFVDETDGKTAEVALSLANTDVRLSKAHGAFAAKNDATSLTHDENGWYQCPLNSTDTGTLGALRLAVHKTGALPVFLEFTVLAANVYDSLIGGGDVLWVDINQINNDSDGVTRFDRAIKAVAYGTVSTGSSTSSVVSSACSPSGAAADQFKGKILQFDKGTTTAALRGVAATISASSNAAAPTFTLSDTLPGTPVSGDTFTIS